MAAYCWYTPPPNSMASPSLLRVLSLIQVSFLVSTSVISEPLEHLKLSSLSLDQFSFTMFDEKLDTNDLSLHIQAGHFAFFEYSIVNWIPHLKASLESNDHRALSGSPDCDIIEFVENLSLFLDLHWMKPKKKSRATRSMVTAIKRLPQLDDGHKTRLLQTWSSAHGLISSDLQDPTCFEALRLYNILRRMRFAMEHLASDPSTQDYIERHYGKFIFKCPRLYCKWFYEGFESAAKRDEHVAKHERAYYCPYVGCAHATLGCKTESELDLHCETYHKPSLTIDDFPSPPPPPPQPPLTPLPQPSPPAQPPTVLPTPRSSTPSPPSSTPAILQPAAFSQNPVLPATRPHTPSVTIAPSCTAAKRQNPASPGKDTVPIKRPRQTGPFSCDACSKVFHRISHLSSHQRTHTDEKPFVCSTCSKRFARQPDLTRHGLLHSADRRFTCRGSLRDGRSWGCGKKFTRADGLARHFKGVAGSLCIKPMLDEEESLKRQPIASTSTMDQTSAAVPQLSALTSPSNPGHLSPAAAKLDNILLPAMTSPPGVTTDAYGYDDTFPSVLYDQHPEISAFNWDIVLPE